MAFAWTKPHYSPIAIDLGADSVKLLQLIASDPPQLIAAAAVDVPEHARGDATARFAFFAEAVRTLIKQQSFKGKRAVCSIPAYQTLVQHIQIARVEHEDFESQIGLHLRQRLNVDPARMVIRHFEVGQVVRDGAAKQEVVCLAASRESVMRCLEIAHRSKLDVVGMHCEPLAILKAFEHLYRGAGAAERTTCFIDLGGSTTKVVIAHGGKLAFAKTIHAAGDHFTKARAKADNISFMEARQLRMQEAGAESGSQTETAGVAATIAGRGGDTQQESPSGVSGASRGSGGGGGLAILEAQIVADRRNAPAPTPGPHGQNDGGSDTLDCLIDELQLSVRYHQSLFPNRPIEKLVFLGGEARHLATCQKIAKALRIGAQLGDPLARLLRVNQAGPAVGVDLDQPQPGWAVPVGLCLSAAEE